MQCRAASPPPGCALEKMRPARTRSMPPISSEHAPSRQRMRFFGGLALLAATAGSSVLLSLGCTDCSGQPRERLVGIGTAESVIVVATIPQGTTHMTWHCWSNANGPRVDGRRASLVWYVPGTSVTSSDIVAYRELGVDEFRMSLPTSCTAEACPIASTGVYDERCGDVDGICATLIWDIDLEVVNPAAIPAGGLVTNFKLDAAFYTLSRSGDGNLNNPQPADADISDINIDMGCALVTP